MRTIRMIVPVSPISVQHGARKGRGGHFYNDRAKVMYYDSIKVEVEHQIPLTGPLKGPLSVGFVFYISRPKCYLARKYPDESFPHVEKPDLTNLIKGAEDALDRAGLFTNDKQICRFIESAKYYTERDLPPRIEVTIEYDETLQ